MGFLTGRVSLVRFRVSGAAPPLFDAQYIDLLAQRACQPKQPLSPDGIVIGWCGSEHVLDTEFDLAKNIINDALLFDLCVETETIPADLLRAYTALELRALTQARGGKPASGRLRREARAAATARLEQEARDGRFRRRRTYPVVWERISNELWFSNATAANLERLANLFEHTFGRTLELITAGTLAFACAQPLARTRLVEDAAPSPFVPSVTPQEVAWLVGERNRDFLGNEFLLWLWYRADIEDNIIPLRDGSRVEVSPGRTLVLECPRGLTGRESISSDVPTRLPEARRAVQAGKWPRKLGLMLVRHQFAYELTLHAETLALSGVKLPPPDDDLVEPRQIHEERIQQLRHLLETVDLLYETFVQRRFDKQWDSELRAMQQWLKREERLAA